MKNNYYVYIYLDPRKPGYFTYKNFSFLFEPFYVGKGRKQRCRNTTDRSKYFKRVLNKIKQSKLKPIIIKMIGNISEEYSFIIESKLINEIGRKNLGGGPLVNLTDGGEGISGYKHTFKTKEIISQKLRIDFNEIIKAFEDNDYTILSKEEEYKNCDTLLKYKHNLCGTIHKISWSNFQQNHGCPLCDNNKVYFSDIIKEFEDRGYELLSKEEDYKNSFTKLKYKHKKCGTIHYITWCDFHDKHGCPKCGKEESSKKKRKPFSEIIELFDNLNYILLTKENEYKNNKQKLKYECDKGHIHSVIFNDLKRGFTCPYCKNQKRRIKKLNLK